MPLHIDVAINESPIESLHIGRIKGGTKADDVNTYLVVNGARPTTLEEWHDYGVEFQHRYGDGALVCLRKALQAIELDAGYKKLAKDPEMLRPNRKKSTDHHCGFDFMPDQSFAKCRCGKVSTNPYYIGDRK